MFGNWLLIKLALSYVSLCKAYAEQAKEKALLEASVTELKQYFDMHMEATELASDLLAISIDTNKELVTKLETKERILAIAIEMLEEDRHE